LALRSDILPTRDLVTFVRAATCSTGFVILIGRVGATHSCGSTPERPAAGQKLRHCELVPAAVLR
jgi:hypothetical protein